MNWSSVFQSGVFAAALAFLGVVAAQAKVNGDYVESHSADVYTGQCFANGEVGLSGDQAILAWHIRSGSWDGVKLDGFSVVAAVKANATLGDPYADPYPAKSVLIIDQRANAQEREALAAFASNLPPMCFANAASASRSCAFARWSMISTDF